MRKSINRETFLNYFVTIMFIVGFVFIVGSIVFAIYSADRLDTMKEQQGQQRLAQVISGYHPLRQIAEHDATNSSFSGSFFVFAGGMSGGTETVQQVTFSWKNNSNQYQFMTVPLDKIRVEMQDDLTLPYVIFNQREGSITQNAADWNNSPSSDDILYFVDSITICVNPKDWPVNIHLPGE